MFSKAPVVSLLILLLQLLHIHFARSCEFEISICEYNIDVCVPRSGPFSNLASTNERHAILGADGKVVNGDGSECFEPDSRSGIVADVSSGDDDLDDLLVWDEDAPCGGDDRSYVHYSGPSRGFGAMTAGAGDLVHTYRAAVFFDGLPVPPGTAGCYAFSTRSSRGGDDEYAHYGCLATWEVARYGTPCPRRRRRLPSNNAVLAFAASAFVAAALTGAWWRRRRRAREPARDAEGDAATDSETESATLSPKIV